MNFVVYFERLDETRVLPEHRHYQTMALQKLRSRNVPLRDQKKHMEQLCSHLNGTEKEAEEAWNAFLQQTGQQKVSWMAEWMDFFPFVFLYSGLFQGIWGCILEPWMDGLQMTDFQLGWSSLLQTVWVYLIFKCVFWVMDSLQKKWQRWLAVVALFAAYLGGLYVFRLIPGSIGINPLLWTVILAVPAWASWQWMHRSGYLNEKSRPEPRVQ